MFLVLLVIGDRGERPVLSLDDGEVPANSSAFSGF